MVENILRGKTTDSVVENFMIFLRESGVPEESLPDEIYVKGVIDYMSGSVESFGDLMNKYPGVFCETDEFLLQLLMTNSMREKSEMTIGI